MKMNAWISDAHLATEPTYTMNESYVSTGEKARRYSVYHSRSDLLRNSGQLVGISNTVSTSVWPGQRYQSKRVIKNELLSLRPPVRVANTTSGRSTNYVVWRNASAIEWNNTMYKSSRTSNEGKHQIARRRQRSSAHCRKQDVKTLAKFCSTKSKDMVSKRVGENVNSARSIAEFSKCFLHIEESR